MLQLSSSDQRASRRCQPSNVLPLTCFYMFCIQDMRQEWRQKSACINGYWHCCHGPSTLTWISICLIRLAWYLTRCLVWLLVLIHFYAWITQEMMLDNSYHNNNTGCGFCPIKLLLGISLCVSIYVLTIYSLDTRHCLSSYSSFLFLTIIQMIAS
jgi:hypothetical protein